MRRWAEKLNIGRCLWLLLLFPAALVLSQCSSRNPEFAEWYATRIYPYLSRAGNHISGLVPFSCGEALVFALAVFLVCLCIFSPVKIIRSKGKRGILAVRLAVNLSIVVSILYFLFMADCGINYGRYSFAQTCGLKAEPSSQAELVQLCKNLAAKVSRLRPQLETDSRSVMKLRQSDLSKTALEAANAYDQIGRDYPLLRPGYGPPKLVYASRLMSRCDITGMFFPFTFEANVNADVPEYTIPVTMCHELSHLRGYMREDEANFIGYLVCEQSSDPDFQYSGNMLAFTYASNALFSADSEEAGQIFSSLDKGVRNDLDYNSAYWKQFEGPVAQVSDSVNDHYLKANRQDDGIKSYGRMVDLLLAEQRAKSKA